MRSTSPPLTQPMPSRQPGRSAPRLAPTGPGAHALTSVDRNECSSRRLRFGVVGLVWCSRLDDWVRHQNAFVDGGLDFAVAQTRFGK